MTTFPTTKIPWESGKGTIPRTEIKCPECRAVTIPEPVLTCLGDLVVRLGGWCTECRRLACLLDMNLENMTKAGLAFLTYEQRLPAEGYTWPKAPPHFFSTKDFAFGANVEGDQT